MTQRYLYRHLFLVIAALLALASCQRANYSFQPEYSNARAGVAGPAAVPAVLGAPAALIEPDAARGRFAAATRLRALRNVAARHRLRVASAWTQPAPQAANRLVRAAQPKAEHHRPGPQEPAPVRHRSRGLALLLALMPVFIFGAHRFYLGYYGAGTAFLLAGLVGEALLLIYLYSFLLAVTTAAIGATATLGIGFLVAGTIILAGLEIWSVVDAVRIATGQLRPKGGEYNPRWFQLRARANGSTVDPSSK